MNTANLSEPTHGRLQVAGIQRAVLITLAAICISASTTAAEDEVAAKQRDDLKEFAKLQELAWEEVFSDSGSEDWRTKWSLDGRNARVTNTDNGMDFFAGPEAFDDAHHAVLWTKPSFEGDLKIEYVFTRLDRETRMVNILYIQATGSGKPGFERDISAWADKRAIPAMKTYFKNMETYHVSYAAFGTNNKIIGSDYIRARRYRSGSLAGTELENEYAETGLFQTGVPHRITVIKRDRDIFMHVENEAGELLCHFENTRFPPITEGRIGLRHMYTRGARYRNFRVSELR